MCGILRPRSRRALSKGTISHVIDGLAFQARNASRSWMVKRIVAKVARPNPPARLEGKLVILPEYKSVYVVDDDPSMRRSMKRLLREHGYETVLFDSAGALIRHGRFEWALCIVLDIDLNGSSGIDLRRQLVTQGIAVPIIFVTGNDSEACRSAAVESGCAAYLNKPFMPQSFIASIQAVCGRAN